MTENETMEELRKRGGQFLNKTLYVGFSRVVDEARWEPPPSVLLEHVEYMARMEAAGTIFAAGPFVDEAGARLTDGMVIVRASSQAEAEAVLLADPFHHDGYRTVEVVRWQLNQGRVGMALRFSNQTYEFE